ncbi:hypothetical protein BJ508DRAFT_315504 [Ascobolus immersus RN42]|uniref:C3H1-type domain-containing protein n=1 Tax=Ascobolus immersus RN42 TaxID=1160509 RepID=A0A3N4HGS4_ASCIM|nr:hypothetical protein BJ508DRAFT_315504 [Ascobolus immersus RN42]
MQFTNILTLVAITLGASAMDLSYKPFNVLLSPFVRFFSMVTTRSSSVAPTPAPHATGSQGLASSISSQVPSSQPESDLPFRASAPAPALETTLQLILDRITALEHRTTSNTIIPTASRNANTSPDNNLEEASTEGASAPSMFISSLQEDMTSSEHLKSVGQWFPSVKMEYIRAILRNEFQPTDIGKLVNSFRQNGRFGRKDGALVPRVSSSGAVEFHNPDAVEEDYNAWEFFQAWEVYKGIFIWGAPGAECRGKLGTALSVYTHTIHKLRRSYSWPAARSYHFSFHQFRVEDSTTLYDPEAWRTIDTSLISEVCLTVNLSPVTSPFDPARIKPRFSRYHPYAPDSTMGGQASSTSSSSLSERIRFPVNPSLTMQSGPPSATGSRRFPGLCDHFNSKPHGCTRQPCRFMHACNSCGRLGHGAFECTSPQSNR